VEAKFKEPLEPVAQTIGSSDRRQDIYFWVFIFDIKSKCEVDEQNLSSSTWVPLKRPTLKPQSLNEQSLDNRVWRRLPRWQSRDEIRSFSECANGQNLPKCLSLLSLPHPTSPKWNHKNWKKSI